MVEGKTEELRRHLVEAHEQLAERDQEFRYWRNELRTREERIEALERQNVSAEAQIAELDAAIRAMRETRVWRIGLRYWSLRDRGKRLLRRAP